MISHKTIETNRVAKDINITIKQNAITPRKMANKVSIYTPKTIIKKTTIQATYTSAWAGPDVVLTTPAHNMQP